MADLRSPSSASARRRSAISTAPLPTTRRDAILGEAWETGVRYYDTAPLYGLGLAETRLNRFLRGKKRDDYVLSTKVGRLLKVMPAGTAHRHRQVLRHADAPRALRLQP